MRRRFSLALSVLLASLALSPVLAGGAIPPLDDTTVQRYTELAGWLIDVPFDAGQRAALRAQVEGYWRSGDRTKMQNVVRSLELWEQLRAAEPDVRETTLAMTRPALLVNLQADMQKGEADSAWLYQQFLRAHPPLAEGKPGSVPLTRDVVDAALDLEYFMNAEVLRREARMPDDAARQAAYRAAALSYTTLSVAEQLEVAAKPGRLVQERAQWARLSPQLRALIRAQMGGNLTAEDQAQIASFHSMGQNQMAMLQGQLNAMQQDSYTIMGGGTTWNSTLGRWEQHGGIVTEYDTGVVRVP